MTRTSHLALASYMLSGRGRRNHAYDLKILIPTEAGNHAVKDGSLRKILEATMSKLKPEAAYFVAQDGLRTAMMFYASDIPGIVEPLFMGFNAEVDFCLL